MKKPLHIFFLFLFALIQSFAPFVHAHVDGIQSGASFHVHDIPHFTHHLSEQELSQSHVESYESQAISNPHENQRDDTFVILDVLSSSTHPSPPPLTKVAVESYDSLSSIPFTYQKPHTQAPPRLS